MTVYVVLRTPSGPVRFRVNEEARDDEPVLVREETMKYDQKRDCRVDCKCRRRARYGSHPKPGCTACGGSGYVPEGSPDARDWSIRYPGEEEDD